MIIEEEYQNLLPSPVPDAISDKQWTLMAFPYSKYDAVIAEGAVRSGKTMFSMISLVDWAMNNFENTSFAVCGYSVKSVERNIIKPYQDLDYSSKYELTVNHADSVLRVSKGNNTNHFYIFGGGNAASYEKVQGLTLAGALIDETVLLNETFVNQVLTRCSVEGAKVYFTCNPGSTSHWFYTKWVSRDWNDSQDGADFDVLKIHFTLDDNPGLSSDARRRLKNMYAPGSVHYQWYIEGLWVKPEGLVYDIFDKKRNVIKRAPKEDGSRWYISVDYGITNPFSALLWRVDKKRAYIVDEVYLDSKDGYKYIDEELYDAMDRLAGDKNIEAVVIDPSASSLKELIRRRGRYDMRNARNEVLPGISTVSSMLKGGLIKICETCRRGVLKEIYEYSWDEKAKNEAPVKQNDHAMDAMRYMAQTILRREYY